MSFVCYLCGGTTYTVRPGKVRDNETLELYECLSCGLVSLSSFDHIEPNFYENSLMNANPPCPADII
ncbi:MAG: hypothetical protein LBS65_06985, partial [Desulfovibrio sp.]|nr:hypothetical protein [Desulfovibrio sp.]